MDSKILIVDDSMTDRMIINNILSDYQTLMASNGLEAIEQIEKDPDIDLIILDLNMPKMNGIEFLEAVRTDPELMHLNVFVMTTSNEESDRLAAQNLKATGYIVKPLSFDKFGGDNSTIDSFSLMLDLLKMK